MSLREFSQLGKSIHDEGKFHYQYFYKPTAPLNGQAGFIIDMNQTAGIPKYNPFAGTELTATPLVGSGNSGIYPGNFIPGKTKHLLRWQMLQLTSASGGNFCYLNDYLMFYPLVDCDNVDLQQMNNDQSLPRYESGEGVRIALVATAPMALSAAVTITYTNSAGVSGRSVTARVIAAPAIGVCATCVDLAGLNTGVTPFFPLLATDTGVRSIESIQFSSGAGGFLVACLVKPIASMQIYEDNVTVEKMYGFDVVVAPEIKEGAYLNMMVVRGANATANYRGELIFINS